MTRLVALREVDERLLGRWRELAAGAVEPNPFFEPEALLPAARLLADGERAQLLIVESGAELLLALPVVSASSFRRVPVPALTSWHHDYSFLGTPLMAADALERTWSAALAHLRSARAAPWLVLGLIPGAGPVAESLSAALAERRLRPTPFEPHRRPVVHRRPEPSSLRQMVSTRRLKNLRRLRRRLGEQLQSDVVTVDHATRGDLGAAQDTFLSIESSGWKARDGGAFACRPAHAHFFRDLCDGFADAGRLQLWTLGSPGRAVAASCNLLAGDAVFHFKIAYDERFAHNSPGVQLELDMLDAFLADPRLGLLDSCTAPGHSVSSELYPDHRSLQTLLVPLYGPHGLVAARSTPLLVRTGRRLRSSGAGAQREAQCGS